MVRLRLQLLSQQNGFCKITMYVYQEFQQQSQIPYNPMVVSVGRLMTSTVGVM